MESINDYMLMPPNEFNKNSSYQSWGKPNRRPRSTSHINRLRLEVEFYTYTKFNIFDLKYSLLAKTNLCIEKSTPRDNSKALFYRSTLIFGQPWTLLGTVCFQISS